MEILYVQYKYKKKRFFFTLNLNSIFLFQLYCLNYNIFKQGRKNYAYSGIATRFGPIVVHMSLILVLVNSALNYFFECVYQEFTSRGDIFHMQNTIKAIRISFVAQDIQWRTNDFWITYNTESKINEIKRI